MKTGDIEKLQKLSALFQKLASDNYEQDVQGRWRLKPKVGDAPFDIEPPQLINRIRENINQSFMHALRSPKLFELDENKLETLGLRMGDACAQNDYKNLRLLGCGQAGLVIEGVTENGRQDALRFGLRTQNDWRLNFPLMVEANYGTLTDDRGIFLLEAMPPVLMLAQQGEEVRMLVEDAFETPGYGRDAVEELLLGTPYVLTHFHDLALWPDGTIVNVDPENAHSNPNPAMTPQQLRCKLLMNASQMVYCPQFLELYTPDGRTKQELFFPTGNPQTPTP